MRLKSCSREGGMKVPSPTLKNSNFEFELTRGGGSQGKRDDKSLRYSRPLTLTLSPIAEFLSDFRIDFGGEGTCHREPISVPNNIGLCLACQRCFDVGRQRPAPRETFRVFLPADFGAVAAV